MAIPRFRIAPTVVRDGTIRLEDPRELHHALHVLRLKPGDACVAFDGEGTEYHGRVAHIAKRALTITVAHVHQHADVTALRVTLAQALPKPPAFDAILRHATELGVARIVPLLTAHSVIRAPAAQWPAKRARWERILTAAAKQCQRSDLPELAPPQSWAAWLASQRFTEVMAIMPTLAVPAPPLATALDRLFAPRAPWHCLLCIGPEGDFTVEEAEQFTRAGGHAASLGSRILRTETAALTSLAILQYECSKHPLSA